MAAKKNKRVILMPFKREFSEKILSGEKTVELRRMIFSSEVNHIVIYETAPTKKIVGYFSVGSRERLPVSEIWQKYQNEIGIKKTSFDEYFSGKEYGYAITVQDPTRLPNEFSLKELLHATAKPPQNFQYLDRYASQRLKLCT